ncbi:hypothetical protein [Pedobacter steynii]|uniref:DUF304 domain-containing protein n=1 Tax=Pedobacter steynii TaxID=430522 RepID=A0A1D7QLT8_9SPHI|nr:hypothetical protein [Pedobacter steynii]AOM79589.1 hypothetical protein BFS30_21985 [Pedobacter steynii]
MENRKTLVIKKSWRFLPLEMANVIIFLLPAAYILYDYNVGIIAFILLIIYMLFVTWIGVYVIYYLRFPQEMILTGIGVRFRQDGFYEWKDIASSRIEKTVYQSKTEEGTMISHTRHTLVVELKNASSVRVSADQLDKTPDQIVRLFEERKSLS